MRITRHAFPATLAAALLVAAVSTAAPPTSGPQAGPLEVFAMASGAVSQGGFISLGVQVANTSTDSSIKVLHDVSIVWADGSRDRLDLGAGRSVDLGPEEGLIFFPMYIVPPDAPLGPTALVVRGHVARVVGPGNGHSGFAPGSHAVDAAEFFVVE